MKKNKILVIHGGLSSEREVSLRTGSAICEALKQKGYEVIPYDPQKEGFANILQHKPDVAFLALHGKYGEDGTIQGLLECYKIPYTGSGVLTSALCYDKLRTKVFLQKYNVITPKFWVFDTKQNQNDFIKTQNIEYPVIVKPNREGSTIGMTVCKQKEQLQQALEQASQYDSEILIEEFIQGTEITVSVLNGKVLPAIQIVPKSGFYDFSAKYTPGSTEYILPAKINDGLANDVAKLSGEIANWLGCKGAVRMDYIIQNDIPYFLEVNTIPGMTQTSLLPKAAQHVGIDFSNLCEQILQTAQLHNVH